MRKKINIYFFVKNRKYFCQFEKRKWLYELKMLLNNNYNLISQFNFYIIKNVIKGRDRNKIILSNYCINKTL